MHVEIMLYWEMVVATTTFSKDCGSGENYSSLDSPEDIVGGGNGPNKLSRFSVNNQ